MEQESLYDPASERAVLAGVFQYGNDAYLDISDVIEIDSFSAQNSVIWKCLAKVLSESDHIDDASFISAAYSMDMSDHFNNSDEKLYIISLKELPIKLENVRKHAIKIRKLQLARDLKNKLYTAIGNIIEITGEETVDEIISKAEKPVLDLTTHLDVENNSPTLLGSDIARS